MSYWKLPIVVLSEMVSSRSDSTNGHIASYILGHMGELQNDSIRDLAAKANVSASSISRFCRDIGLHDFNELKGLAASYQPPFGQTSSASEPGRIKDDYITAVTTSLEMVRESVDVDLIDQLCRDIRRYQRVAVFGVLKSEGVSMNLQADLALLGKHVNTKLPFSEQIDYLEGADEHDLIIIFSYRGVYFEYGLPQNAKKLPGRKPKIYFITSDPKAKASGKYDEVIWFRSRQDHASHPYQLQLVAGLIAERYSHLIAETEE